MMKEKNQNNPVQTVCTPSLPAAAEYQAPDIEIMDIELEQSILGGSQVPDMPPTVW